MELAKAYVALSNAHRLNLVIPMFAADARYQSPNVGVFDGAAAIADMMSGFFAAFPDVYWNARDYRCTDDGHVRFDFEMTATRAATGESIRRAGSEELAFTAQGLIARLDVHSS